MTNFGELATVLKNAAMANVNRSTAPIYSGTNLASESIVGSTVQSALMAQAYLSSSNEFLWGLDTWDDEIHVVT